VHLALTLCSKPIAGHALLAVFQIFAALPWASGNTAGTAFDGTVATKHQPVIRNGSVLHGSKKAALLLLDAPKMAELIAHFCSIRADLGAQLRPCKNVLLAQRLILALHLLRPVVAAEVS